MLTRLRQSRLRAVDRVITTRVGGRIRVVVLRTVLVPRRHGPATGRLPLVLHVLVLDGHGPRRRAAQQPRRGCVVAVDLVVVVLIVVIGIPVCVTCCTSAGTSHLSSAQPPLGVPCVALGVDPLKHARVESQYQDEDAREQTEVLQAKVLVHVRPEPAGCRPDFVCTSDVTATVSSSLSCSRVLVLIMILTSLSVTVTTLITYGWLETPTVCASEPEHVAAVRVVQPVDITLLRELTHDNLITFIACAPRRGKHWLTFLVPQLRGAPTTAVVHPLTLLVQQLRQRGERSLDSGHHIGVFV